MNANPYESPKVVGTIRPRNDRRMETDWYSLAGLFVGSIAAVAVGFAIRSERVALGDSWVGWLLFGTTTTVGLVAIGGRVVGWLARRRS